LGTGIVRGASFARQKHTPTRSLNKFSLVQTKRTRWDGGQDDYDYVWRSDPSCKWRVNTPSRAINPAAGVLRLHRALFFSAHQFHRASNTGADDKCSYFGHACIVPMITAQRALPGREFATEPHF
jgi:hypothetical protein